MNRVNVVVPTHRRPAGLEACLAAIECPAGIDVEVIVVENGSSGAADVASSYGATYLHIDEGNVARARNTGAVHRNADAVAFLDDDVVPHPGWLEKITAPILEDRADATAGWVEVVTDGDVDRRFLAFYVHSETALDPHRPFLGGLNMAVRQEAFLAVGGFRTELGPGALGVGGEDILLGLMLADAGYRLVAGLEAKVDHHVPPARFTDEELRRRAVGGGRADGWITYHYHHSYYRFPLLRMAGFRALAALPRRDRMKTYRYLHSYGLHQQIHSEAAKPHAVARPIKAAR